MSTDAKQPVNSQDTKAAIRRANLRKLMVEHGAAKLATMLGYKQSSFLSQMAGPNPTREVTEKTVRAFEKQLGLPAGAMDKPMGDEVAPAELSSAETIALMLKLAGVAATMCEKESVMLSPSKYATLLSVGIADVLEHKNTIREDHIRQLVSLLK